MTIVVAFLKLFGWKLLALLAVKYSTGYRRMLFGCNPLPLLKGIFLVNFPFSRKMASGMIEVLNPVANMNHSANNWS